MTPGPAGGQLTPGFAAPQGQRPEPSPSCRRWSRDFPGQRAQVGRARDWVRRLLPAGDHCETLLMIVDELAANAVSHTASALPGGVFNCDLAWWPGMIRVVVSDQGSALVPAIVERAADANADAEGGWGLLVVRELSAAMGNVGDANGQSVWADLGLPPRLRPLPPEPEGSETADQVIAALRRAHPWVASIWYGAGTRDWWASLPRARDEDDIIIAPSPAALSRLLAARALARPESQPGAPQRYAAAPVPPAQPTFTPRRPHHRMELP